MSPRRVVACAIALLLPGAVVALLPRGMAQEAPGTDVEAAIQALGSPDDKESGRAADTLRGLAFVAEPFLLRALPEATGAKKDRIQDILRFFGHATDDELLALEKRIVTAIDRGHDAHILEAT